MKWLIATAILLAGVTLALAQSQFLLMGVGTATGGASGPDLNCIEYQTSDCILYNTGSTNILLVQ